MCVCRLVVAVVVSAIACGAQALETETLWPGPDVRPEAGGGAEVSTSADGGIDLKVGRALPNKWPAVYLTFPEPRDLSKVEELRVSITNQSAQTLRIGLKIKGDTQQGQLPERSFHVRPFAADVSVLRLFAERWVFDKPHGLVGLKRNPQVGAGSSYSLGKVRSISIYLPAGTHDAEIGIRKVELASGGGNAPNVTVLKADEFCPWVDEFGQANFAEWPDRVHSVEELRARGREEVREIRERPSGIPSADRFGGWADGPQLKATGRFRTEKVNGRWWFVDPDGHLFFALGVNFAWERIATGITGRERYFEKLPPETGDAAPFWERHDKPAPANHNFYSRPENVPFKAFSFTGYNLFRKYGADWSREDAKMSGARMRSWGLNTVTSSRPELCRELKLPYVVSIGPWSRPIVGAKGYWASLLDPYAPEFAESCRRAVRQRLELGTNEFCLGWTAHNELSWGKDGASLARSVLASPDDQPAKVALLKILSGKGISPETATENDLASLGEALAEKYYSTVRAAIKEAAPEALYLGDRNDKHNPETWRAASRNVDVLTVNIYDYHPQTELPEGSVDKPFMVTEFHFGTYDTGYFYASLLPVRDARAVADSYRSYVGSAIDNPNYVGACWFCWRDCPVSGDWNEGANAQCGLVSVADIPCSEMVKAMRDVSATAYPRRYGHDAVITADNAEIVVADGAAKPVLFAAQELNDAIGRAFGRKLPVVRQPGEGKVSIVLGDCAANRAAGIDVSALPRDAFTVKVAAGRIHIAGRDDAKADLAAEQVAKGNLLMKEHATLFGAYEFLERFFGVRYYFPGEIGTVVPRRDSVRVPVGTFTVAPDFKVRDILLMEDGPVPGETDRTSRRSWKALDWLRLRLQTESIPCMHGQAYMSFPERFHKTHPEYFALVNGKGGAAPKRAVVARCESMMDGQMCQSSGIWDEIYGDCRAYLDGKLTGRRNFRGRFLDVMPQDSMVECQCDACQKSYVKGTRQFAKNLVWRRTAELADRLTADGFSDFILTQMAYHPYRGLPDCEIPSNVWVMVAETGPWGIAAPGKTNEEVEEIRRWSQKANGNIWLWTYPSKFGEKSTPGVPDMAPRAFARYYGRVAPYVRGAFLETEGEKSIFHYLNSYVYAKLAWDNGTDVERLLDEHFRLMFGAAAPEMAEFYADLERKWTERVFARWYKDGDETRPVVATDVTLWREIYSPVVRAGWRRLFDRAEAKLAGDPESLRRLRFFRTEFLDYLCTFGERFDARADATAARRECHSGDAGLNILPAMPEARHLVVTNAGDSAEVCYRLDGKLKPRTRYRLSVVFRLKDVRPQNLRFVEGAFLECRVGTYMYFCTGRNTGTGFVGTVDWTRREYEFATPGEIKANPAGIPPLVRFVLCRSTGEAWVDCMKLEEIEERLDTPPFFKAFAGGKEIPVETAFVADLPHGREWMGHLCPPDLRKVAYVVRPVVRGRTPLSFEFDDRQMMYGNKSYPREVNHALGAHDRSMWVTAFDDKPFAIACGDGSTIIYVVPCGGSK